METGLGKARFKPLARLRSSWEEPSMTESQEDEPGAAAASKPGNAEDPRTYLAADRTLLAWIRTGLALMGFGFVVARFGLFLREIAAVRQNAPAHSSGLSLGIGTALVVLGVVVTLLAAGQHRGLLRRLQRGERYLAPRWPLGVIVAGALAIVGIGMVIYLLLVSY
jgi:putative membrane protein